MIASHHHHPPIILGNHKEAHRKASYLVQHRNRIRFPLAILNPPFLFPPLSFTVFLASVLALESTDARMFVSRAVRYMWLLTMIHGYVIRPPSRITNRLGFITGTTSDLRGDNWSLQRVRMTPDTAEQEEPLSNSEKGSNDIDVEVNAALDDDSPVNSSENDEDDSATSNVTNVNEPSTEDHIDENQQQQQQQQQPNDKDVVMEDEVKEPEEDAELIALKEEIKAAETLLKEKRRQLSYVADEAEEYTQAGYARKVAEMENMRRARSVSYSFPL